MKAIFDNEYESIIYKLVVSLCKKLKINCNLKLDKRQHFDNIGEHTAIFYKCHLTNRSI